MSVCVENAKASVIARRRFHYSLASKRHPRSFCIHYTIRFFINARAFCYSALGKAGGWLGLVLVSWQGRGMKYAAPARKQNARVHADREPTTTCSHLSIIE